MQLRRIRQLTHRVYQRICRAVLPDSILTIDVDAHVESFQEKEDARWHSILNAHRTRKILSGTLSGIETLESGWVVAVTYYNGFRVIIPMEEMMINLSGDGRENANTLNRQTRIANNMLGCQIDFMVKDLDAESKSVVASRKDAMMKKRQMFYESENPEEKPMLYPGRIVEARVIAVAARAVRLEVFGVEVSVRARDMAWEWISGIFVFTRKGKNGKRKKTGKMKKPGKMSEERSVGSPTKKK